MNPSYYEIHIMSHGCNISRDGQPWNNRFYKDLTAALAAIAKSEGKFTEERKVTLFFNPIPDYKPLPKEVSHE